MTISQILCFPLLARHMSGRAGMWFVSMTIFPFIRRRDSLLKHCLTVPPSSSSVFLARTEASFLTLHRTTAWKHPRDSNTIGEKEIPYLWQSSLGSAILLSYLDVRAWPGVTAASATSAPCHRQECPGNTWWPW